MTEDPVFSCVNWSLCTWDFIVPTGSNLFSNLVMFFFPSEEQVRKILLYISSFRDYSKNICVSEGNLGRGQDSSHLTLMHSAEAASSYPRFHERNRHL